MRLGDVPPGQFQHKQEVFIMKKLAVLFLALMLVFSFSSAASAKTVFKLAHVYNPGHAWDKGAHHVAKLVKEKSGGEIEIQVFPASQLGTEEQITEAVIFGSVDMCVSGAGQIGNLFKPISICEMPYTFKDNNHVLRFAKSDIAQKMFSDLEKEFNIKVVGTSSFGIRQLTSNKPVKSPADLKGFKLRVPEQNICVAYAKAMGDPNPLYNDIGYARKSEYGRLICPPGFTALPEAKSSYKIVDSLIKAGAPQRMLAGGIEYEFPGCYAESDW